MFSSIHVYCVADLMANWGHTQSVQEILVTLHFLLLQFLISLKLRKTCFEARACFDLPAVSQISEECTNSKEGWSQGYEQPKDKKTSLSSTTIFLVVEREICRKKQGLGWCRQWYTRTISNLNGLVVHKFLLKSGSIQRNYIEIFISNCSGCWQCMLVFISFCGL